MQSRSFIRKNCLAGFPIIQNNTGQRKTLLAIPEICADKIITLYQASLFAGHQGMIKCI